MGRPCPLQGDCVVFGGSLINERTIMPITQLAWSTPHYAFSMDSRMASATEMPSMAADMMPPA